LSPAAKQVFGRLSALRAARVLHMLAQT
jgi:hypothetical protein